MRRALLLLLVMALCTFTTTHAPPTCPPGYFEISDTCVRRYGSILTPKICPNGQFAAPGGCAAMTTPTPHQLSWMVGCVTAPATRSSGWRASVPVHSGSLVRHSDANTGSAASQQWATPWLVTVGSLVGSQHAPETSTARATDSVARSLVVAATQAMLDGTHGVGPLLVVSRQCGGNAG
ncbi:uncharacterized protein LOC126354297 [Schistocerca gregaria]|uniref:uncharacterized protein LOC126354297 n=1 Tax=Schistocerca gregaria TaxID=7010 RepID=UPI00211E8D21|nr:uncharacterized protein LOC126354297 [Schistocerca gregaria]